MGKRKHRSEDGEVILSDTLVDSLKSLLQDVSPERKSDAAIMLQHLEACPIQRVGPIQRTHQAIEYNSVTQAAKALGIDYDDYDRAYTLSLKDTSGDAKALDPGFAYVVKKFQTSRYTQSRPVEALSRTLLDVILLDRLESLQDQHGHYLQLDPEVNISVTTDSTNNTKEIIQGRMGWALNYDAKRPGSILVVWEAKRIRLAAFGLPQLLVCMVGVLQSRRDRVNQTVWGMVSDSSTFQFAFLDDKKKFYTSDLYRWARHQSTILAYIDAILFDAMQSSPHTTPTKTANATIRNYQRYLKGRWEFGDEAEDEAVDIGPGSVVNVVREGKDIVLRSVGEKEVETSEEAEEA